MLKSFFALIALGAVGLGGWYVFDQYRTREFLSNLNTVFRVKSDSSRKNLAIQLASASLAEVKNPNVYAFIETKKMETLVHSLESVRSTLPSVGMVRDLRVTPQSLTTEEGALSVRIGIEGTIEKPAVGFKGSLTITAAPQLSGTNLELLPLDASVAFEKVTFSGVEDDKILPPIIQAATRPVVDYIVSRVGTVSIPIDLGVAKELDLAEALRDVKEVQVVEGGRTQIYLAFESSAALATTEGLHLIGAAGIVSQQEMDEALSQLKLLSKAILKSPPGITVCETCRFVWSDADKYLACLRKRLDCEADKALGIRGKASNRLSPIQALALRQLAKSTESESRETYETLKSLLAPVLRQLGPGPTGEFDSQMRQVRSDLTALRAKVEPNYSFPSNESLVALRLELLSSSVNQLAARIAPKGSIVVDRKQEFFNHTIKSPPAADLKCDQNKRGCPSDFSYPAYNPRGCDSGCGTRNCTTIFGREICVNGIDLNCQARKLDCERLKESERLGYEAAKATAKANWSLAKLDCERLKEIETIGCNINQEWLRAVGDKELGRIEGNAVISDVQATVAYHGLQVSAGLESIKLGVMVGGSAAVDASFVFTPLNGGYIACIAQWGGNVRASVALPSTEIGLTATLDKTASKDSIVFRLDQVDVGIKMSPAPGVALLSQNPHMAVLCPAVGALSAAAPLPVAIALPLLDTIPIKVPAREIRLPIFGSWRTDELNGVRPELRFGSESVLVSMK